MSDEESTDLSELDFDEHHHQHHNQPEDIWGSGEGDTDWSDHEQIMPDLIPERGDEDADEEKDCWVWVLAFCSDFESYLNYEILNGT